MLSAITNLIVSLVGFTAIIVYWLTRRRETCNAANILMMDIVRAEEIVLLIRERNTLNLEQKVILTSNNWATYRHLFVSKLSYLEVVGFNRFFDACASIDAAQERLVAIYDSGLEAKALITQEKIFSIQNPSTPKGQLAKQKYIEQIDQEVHMFTPMQPLEVMIQNINLMGDLVNTPAFEKLQRIGARRFSRRKG